MKYGFPQPQYRLSKCSQLTPSLALTGIVMLASSAHAEAPNTAQPQLSKPQSTEGKFLLDSSSHQNKSATQSDSAPRFAALENAPPGAPAPAAADVPVVWTAPQFTAPAGSGAGIARTMRLLATSTPQKRNRVRILFYGQSITQQEWAKNLGEELRRRFPHADLEIENRAIGGFASQLLVKAAEQDLYPFYPDLMIFHVYGSHVDYETLIANVRKRTTAEILMATDHSTNPGDLSEETDPAKLSPAQWGSWFNHVFLPNTAKQHGAELADVRGAWKGLLTREKREPQYFLADGVHLNERGNALMQAILSPYFRYDAALPVASEKWVRTYPIKPSDWKNGRLKFDFTGNRVDVIAGNGQTKAGARVDVLIDSKKPSELPGTIHFTRPSIGHSTWVPAILKVGSNASLVPETWTATVTQVNPDKSFRYSVSGSVTGEDGEGQSDADFVSRSGRVKIDKGDWFTGFSKDTITVGFKTTWDARLQSSDFYQTPLTPNAATEYATTLAQGFSNAAHTLELISSDGKQPAISAIRVYEPPLRSTP
jgi:hypothetical protein